MTRWILSLIALGLMSCTSPPTSDDNIARVNGIDIRVRDYLNLFESLKPKDASLASKDNQNLRNLVIQTLVRRAVILSAATERNINISDGELAKGIARYQSDYPETLFHESLLEGMVDEKEWRELVRQNLLIEKLFQASKPNIKSPTDEELLDYYQSHPQQFVKNSEAVSLHLVVADEALAKDVRTKIETNKMTFERAAKEYSTGPEGQTDAKIRVERGTMPPEIDEILFNSPLQKLSKIVKTEYGFHLLKVLSRTSPVNLDFKSVKSEIAQRVFEERRRAWLEKFEENLIREAEIEYNRNLISKLELYQ